MLLLLLHLGEPQLLGESLGAARPCVDVGGAAQVADLADPVVEAVGLSDLQVPLLALVLQVLGMRCVIHHVEVVGCGTPCTCALH